MNERFTIFSSTTTLLHWAIGYGTPNMVYWLLKLGVDANIQDSEGFSAFDIDGPRLNRFIVNIKKERNAREWKKIKQDADALSQNQSRGSDREPTAVPTVDNRMASSSPRLRLDLNKTPEEQNLPSVKREHAKPKLSLQRAISRGRVDIVKTYIENDPSLVTQLFGRRRMQRFYPLCHGVKIRGNRKGVKRERAVKIINYLLEKGADVNARSPHADYKTALHIAIDHNLLDIVKLLCEEHPVDFTVKIPECCTFFISGVPLLDYVEYANYCGNKEIEEYLEQKMKKASVEEEKKKEATKAK